MINNPHRLPALALSCLLGACAGTSEADANAFQGIVELDETDLAFEIAGRIETLSLEEGDALDEGAELAALDCALPTIERAAREAELAAANAHVALLRDGTRREDIAAARAELVAAQETAALAETELQRQLRLETQGATTPAVVDQRRRQLATEQARARALGQRVRALRDGARTEEVAAAEANAEAARQALAAADARVARCSLSTPLAGVVLDVLVERGEVVPAGAPVARIGNVDHPYVDVYVPQGRIDEMPQGARVEVRTDAVDEALPGQVEHVARQLEYTPRFLFSEEERETMVLRVRVRVDDDAHQLHAGVPAFVRRAK